MPQLEQGAEQANYHIMVRTAQCKRWLLKRGFRDIAEGIITAFADIYCVKIHSLVLMTNHIHIVLTLKKSDLDEAELQHRFELLQAQNYRKQKWHEWLGERFEERITSLSWFMWEVNRRIAMRFNKLNKTKGHFWGGRYKSKLIEDEAYFAEVMSYLDQNPCKAGMAEKPSEYKWCTAARRKKALDQGQIPEIEAFGFLRNYIGEARARAWIEAQDKLALYRNAVKKAIRSGQPVETLLQPQIRGLNIDKWLQSMLSLESGKWSQGNIKNSATEFG